MERLFSTHAIRSSREALPLWSMTPLDDGGLPAHEKVVVPSEWESHPLLKNYWGRAVFEQAFEGGGNLRFWFGESQLPCARQPGWRGALHALRHLYGL